MLINSIGTFLGQSPRNVPKYYCFSYGCPSAAGGVARPTTPVSTIIVSRYGNICGNCEGISGRKMLMVAVTDEPSPKISAPANAPSGDQLPKIIAANPINPSPLVISGLNTSTASSVNHAPASP